MDDLMKAMDGIGQLVALVGGVLYIYFRSWQIIQLMRWASNITNQSPDQIRWEDI